MDEYSSNLAAVAASTAPLAPICDRCGGRFAPRSGSGGRRQRFCSSACRSAFHAQRGQRGPTCAAPIDAGVGEYRDEKRAPAADCGAARPGAATPTDWSDPPSDDEEFDWGGDDVILPPEPATAIYFNSAGQVVVRQRGEFDYRGDGDPCVFFDRQRAVIVARAILALVEDERR